MKSVFHQKKHYPNCSKDALKEVLCSILFIAIKRVSFHNLLLMA